MRRVRGVTAKVVDVVSRRGDGAREVVRVNLELGPSGNGDGAWGGQVRRRWRPRMWGNGGGARGERGTRGDLVGESPKRPVHELVAELHWRLWRQSSALAEEGREGARLGRERAEWSRESV